MLQDLSRVLFSYWEQFIYLLPKLFVGLIVLGLALLVATRLSALLGGKLRARSHDLLLADFLTRFSKWALLLVGVVVAMQVVGLSGMVSGVLAGAGLSAFIVGFALKDIAENFLAGVVLAFNRPFRIHDTVQVKDLLGRVEALNLRTTVIKTFDGKDIFIPNAVVLREPLTNFTLDGHIRQDFVVSVDLGDAGESQQLSDLLLRYVQANAKVENQEGHRPYVVLEKSVGSTVDLHVYFWTLAEDYRRGTLELKSELMQGIGAMLASAGYTPPKTMQ
ncbi:mechanosensitive ion channel family protein [Hymenobacter persicinus]|uniref:Mechanosensitive ion channel n=1 Tax=Hymenobacter persicinus TaxID=2025506 RepID=A0A4Q5LD38_9BACT|nr:mechanosensitive ion channel domain-containing protein [Hymenobacter persicinus]RYU81278.1 mechanosensitive ion channel [Hymenobacter persicinus]